MPIGDRIRKRRLELKMTQDELAKIAGYASRVSINKIENDGRKLPQDKIKAIAIALKTTPSYLLDWTDEIKGDNRINMTSTPGELTIIAAYRAMNDNGKERLVECACELSELPRYRDTGTDVAGTHALSA